MVMEVMTMNRLFRSGASKFRAYPTLWKLTEFAPAATAASGHRWMSAEVHRHRNIGISAHIDRYAAFQLLVSYFVGT
jgi:hypothetical protein